MNSRTALRPRLPEQRQLIGRATAREDDDVLTPQLAFADSIRADPPRGPPPSLRQDPLQFIGGGRSSTRRGRWATRSPTEAGNPVAWDSSRTKGLASSTASGTSGRGSGTLRRLPVPDERNARLATTSAETHRPTDIHRSNRQPIVRILPPIPTITVPAPTSRSPGRRGLANCRRLNGRYACGTRSGRR